MCAPQTLEIAADAAGDVLDSLELGEEGNALGGKLLGKGKALISSLLARAKDASLPDQVRCARIREVAVAAVLRLRGALSLIPDEGAAPLLEEVTQELVTRHIYDSDKRVKALLGCESKRPSDEELAHAWEAQRGKIQLTMQVRCRECAATHASASPW